MGNRSCTINIYNQTGYELNNPQTFLYSGQMRSVVSKIPANPLVVSMSELSRKSSRLSNCSTSSTASTATEGSVASSSTISSTLGSFQAIEAAQFEKSAGQFRGSAGMLTYDVVGTNYKIVMMWSVPFDYNLFKNEAYVDIVPKTTATDELLYDRVYKKKKKEDCITVVDFGDGDPDYLGIQCTMGTTMESVMNVVLTTSLDFVDEDEDEDTSVEQSNHHVNKKHVPNGESVTA